MGGSKPSKEHEQFPVPEQKFTNMRLDTTTQPTLISTSPAPSTLEPAFAPNQPLGGVPEEDSMGSIIQFAKKRAWLVLVAALLGLAGAILVNVILPKLYTAQASIELVEDRSSQFFLQQSSDMQGASMD